MSGYVINVRRRVPPSSLLPGHEGLEPTIRAETAGETLRLCEMLRKQAPGERRRIHVVVTRADDPGYEIPDADLRAAELAERFAVRGFRVEACATDSGEAVIVRGKEARAILEVLDLVAQLRGEAVL